MLKYLAIISIVLFSCSPVKRHSRLVKKHPYVHTIDSVKLIDTIRLHTESVRVDTIVKIQALKDGVTVKRKNLTMTARIVRDSFYLEGECDTIFIDKIIERTIPVKYYVDKTNMWSDFWRNLGIFLGGVISLIVIYHMIKK